MGKQKYFFCYDPEISRQLHAFYGFPFITNAVHPKTGKMFWLYERTDSLNAAIGSIKQ